MSSAKVEAGVSINNGPLFPCTLVIEHEVVLDISSLSPKPDPRWSTVDDAGHFHAYNQSGVDGARYPTLMKGAGEYHQYEEPDEDGEEGWWETWLECRVCRQRIDPGTIPGPHHDAIPGRTSYQVLVTLPAPLPEGEVSVRITSDGDEDFGIAVPRLVAGDNLVGVPRYDHVLMVVGVLGHTQHATAR